MSMGKKDNQDKKLFKKSLAYTKALLIQKWKIWYSTYWQQCKTLDVEKYQQINLKTDYNYQKIKRRL